MADLFAPPSPDELKNNKLMAPPSPEELKAVKKPEMGLLKAAGTSALKGFGMGVSPLLAGAGQAIGETGGIISSGGGVIPALKNIPEAFGRGRRAQVQEQQEASERLGLLDIPVQIAGGLASAPLTAGAAIGRTALGTLGRVTGLGAAQGAVQGLGEEGTAGGAAKSAAIGAGLGLLGGSLAAGAQRVGQSLQKPLKSNAGNVRQAAKEIGAKPTIGMLIDDPVLQKAESALSQKPTIPAAKYREGIEEVQDRLQAASQNILAPRSAQSATVAGEQARENVIGRLLEQGKEAAEPFKKIQGSTQFMDVDPKGFQRAISGISKIKAPFPGGKDVVAKYADEIAQGVQTVDDVKSWRTAVGNDMRKAFDSGDKNLGNVLGQVYKRLEALEGRQILRSSIETAKQGFPRKGEAMGKDIAKGIVGELKTARKNFAQYRRDVEKIARSLGFNEKLPPEQLVKKLENLEAATLTQKLFQGGKPQATAAIKEAAPQAFEVARKAHLKELFDDVIRDNEIQVGRLVQKLDKYEPETLNMLLGGPDKVRQFQNIKTVYEAAPKMAGPSGTPAGNLFMNFLSVVTSPAESAKDAVTAAMLRRATSGEALGRSVARGLIRPVQGLQAVTDNE